MPKKTLYETLEITIDAKPEEIKKAFRKLALLRHPDKDPGNIHAPERFREIQEAYSILSNINERAIYDEEQEMDAKAHATPSTPRTTFNQFFASCERPKKIVHFTSMYIVDAKPHGIEIAIPVTEKVPEGFFFKQSSSGTYLGFDRVPEKERGQYYSYSSETITDWHLLKNLFDTLKASEYSVIYTFNRHTQEVNTFDQFKKAIISEHERNEQLSQQFYRHGARQNRHRL